MAYPSLTLVSHFRSSEIRKRYLSSKKGIERSHWQIIWHLSHSERPLSTEQIARLVGCTADWVRKLAGRYNRWGARGLEDRRRSNGRKSLLDGKTQEELKGVLGQRAWDGGLWTGPKVSQWMGRKLGRRVSLVTGWHYLQRLGFSLQRPRPRHPQASRASCQSRFKKNSRRL